MEDVEYEIKIGVVEGSEGKAHMELEIRQGEDYIVDCFDIDELEDHIASLKDTLREMKELEKQTSDLEGLDLDGFDF